MERVGQGGREGREESVCEQQSTIRARVGKHTWRRGCVEREREREISGNGEKRQ